MKKMLVGLLLISLCSMNASDASSSVKSYCQVAGAALIGVVGIKLYQAFVGDQPEDTLLIGTESCSMRSSCTSSTTPARHTDYKEYKAGVRLGSYLIGYKSTTSTTETDGLPENKTITEMCNIKDGDKPISRNDWHALAVGTATGIGAYALMKYLDRK